MQAAQERSQDTQCTHGLYAAWYVAHLIRRLLLARRALHSKAWATIGLAFTCLRTRAYIKRGLYANALDCHQAQVSTYSLPVQQNSIGIRR